MSADTADAARSAVPDDLVSSLKEVDLHGRDVGFDIGRIDFDAEAERGAARSFTERLNARAGNLTVQRGSGLTGMGSRVRLRGVNSLLLGNNPLIFVDGVRVSNSTDLQEIFTGGQSTSRFEDLDPGEIARVQVLRGPAATSLYGAEAAAGVLLVETKRGRAAAAGGAEEGDGPRVTLRTTQGFVEDGHRYPDTYANVTDIFGITDPADPRLTQFRTAWDPATGAVFVLDNPFMDPDTRPFRRGHHQSYAGTLRGEQGGLGYFGSLRYQDLQGTLHPNEMMRFNARANLGVAAGNLVDVSGSAGFIRSEHRFPDDNDSLVGHGGGALLGFPIHSFGTDPVEGPGRGDCLLEVLTGQGTASCELRNGLHWARFDLLESQEQGEDQTRFMGGAQGRLTPTGWLAVTATLGLDRSSRRVFELFPTTPEVAVPPFDLGYIADSRQKDRTTTLGLGGTASFDLSPDLVSTTSAGFQRFGQRSEVDTCSGRDLPPGERSCQSALVTTGNAWELESGETGVLFHQRFAYRGILFGSVGLRGDDHDRVGGGRIWSPGLTLAAAVSEMPFWRLDAFDALRLRLAWGVASQSPPVVAFADVARPERTRELEVGFDAELLDRRVSLGFTYFDSETTDALVPLPITPSTGPVPRFGNVGVLTNRGIEASVDVRILERSDITWDVRFGASTSNPVVEDLGLDGPLVFDLVGGSQMFHAGFPPGAYVGRVIESATRDDDGQLVGVSFLPGNIGVGGLRYLGNPNIRNEQTLSATVTLLRRFRAFTLLDRKGGHDILNATRLFRTPFVHGGTASSFSEDWAFREHRFSSEARAMMELGMIAPFVEGGSFVKWRELALTYDLPSTTAGRVGAARAAVTVGGRNLRTITGYSGVDPEVNFRGARDDHLRNDFAGIGIPRTYYAALHVTF